jgi:hypothetical protein
MDFQPARQEGCRSAGRTTGIIGSLVFWVGATQDFLRGAFVHLNTIGSPNVTTLFTKAGHAQDALDEACIRLYNATDADSDFTRASQRNFWAREPSLRPAPDINSQSEKE